LFFDGQLYYIREEKRKRQLRRGDTTSSGLCAGRKALEAAINNGDLDFADINIADMDPQDIRVSWNGMVKYKRTVGTGFGFFLY
jgi:hypothetical protein